MKLGKRGQVTIPKNIRDRVGLKAETEVEFSVVGDSIVLKRTPRSLDLAKWKAAAASFNRLGYFSVDEFIDNVRGR